MKHELKIEPPEFSRIADGSKTFLTQREKLGFQKGDEVELREYDYSPQNSTSDAPKGFTDSAPLHFTIGYVESNGSSATFSLLAPPPKKKK